MFSAACSCAMAIGTSNAAMVKYNVVVDVFVGKRRDRPRHDRAEVEAPAGADEVEGIAPWCVSQQCFGRTRGFRGGGLTKSWCLRKRMLENRPGESNALRYTDMGPSDVESAGAITVAAAVALVLMRNGKWMPR